MSVARSQRCWHKLLSELIPVPLGLELIIPTSLVQFHTALQAQESQSSYQYLEDDSSEDEKSKLQENTQKSMPGKKRDRWKKLLH